MKEKDIFTKPYDVVLFVCGVLKKLRSGDIDSFEQRLRSQKIQYFAQLFGASPHYSFNLYIRGPYSPDLAHDLFQIKNKNIKVEQIEFIPKELKSRFLNLKQFIDGKSDRQLEIVATLHWLISIARLSELEAKKKLIDLKGVSADELKYAFKCVKEL